jgi:uncharacterized repeat protein (TIGR01451 family)
MRDQAVREESRTLPNSAWRVLAASAILLVVAMWSPLLARAANPAANIDQCRNGTVASPVQCANAAWVNGNLGETNSHYREHDSVPFRATLTNLDTSAPSHTLVIQYDTLQSGLHAYDYLTSYNRTETTADATTGVAGLTAGNCFAIPPDLLNVFTNPGSSQVPGCIQIWNGTITNIAYGVADPSGKRSVTVAFSASDPTVLVAWGGHIASQIDWGLGNSASSISGSPYHMRLLDLDDSGLGNQDRSIKAAAILPIPPGFTTQASSSSISIGQSVTDTATLSGANGSVTGSINFFVCGPALSNPDCIFGGTQVGSATTISAGQAVSDAFAPSLPGKYCFRAEYTPDATSGYSPAHHTDQTLECFDVSNPSLQVSKTADSASVSAGDQIGFTITVSNSGPGAAFGVTVSDPLPSGAGVSWSVDAANSDTGCTIAAGTLSCSFGDLAAPASKHVHVISATTKDSCKAYPNTASAQATNNAEVQASASLTVNCGDIEISKLADAASVSAGDQIGFTITVHNAGSGIARNVSVSDLLPTDAGTSWSIDLPNSSAGWSIAAGMLSYGPADLAAGGSVHVHIVSPTSSASCGSVDNSASVSTTNDGSAQGSDSVGVDCPDIEVVKTPDAATINAGDAAGFTITVTNLGSGIARNVMLHDPLPSGPAWGEDSTDCSIAAAVLDCSFGDLAPGAHKSVHVSGETSPADCGTLHNVASASATNEDGADLDNNSSSADIQVQCPDLEVQKTADQASVSAGDQIGFTITVTNIGLGDAKNVSVSDALPTGGGLNWSIESQSDEGVCSLNAAKTQLSCSKALLGDDSSFSVHLASSTTQANCGTIPNTATAAAGNEDEGDLDNNRDSAEVLVECADLSINKTADAASVKAGQQLGFTITVANAGPGVAKDVHVTDVLPTNGGLSWSVDTATSAAGCSVASGKLSCSFGDLAKSASRSVHIVSPTTTATCGTVSNTASATTSNDGSPQSSSSVAVGCPIIDLAITKLDDPDPITVGNRLTYTMVATNNGPDTATNVIVTDSLPSEVSFVSASSTQGTCLGTRAVTCHVGTMSAGASVTITIVVRPTATGRIMNVVVVAGNEAESNTINNRATADTLVIGKLTPPVCYAVTVNPRSLTVGKRTKVTVTVRAGGKAVARVMVTLRGAGINKGARTNSRGLAHFAIKAKKSGILLVRVPNHRTCTTQRIGVVGVFNPPPLTG